jgi:hypothetical protein
VTSPEEQQKKVKDTGATEGGIPGLKAPSLEQLPDEMLSGEQLREKHKLDEARTQREGEAPGLYGDFTQVRDDPTQVKREQIFDQEQDEQDQSKAVQWFANKTTEGFKYWAQFSQYKIKMDDGRIEHYERRPITKYQADELLDLSSEIQALRDINTEKKLTVTQVRQKQRTLDALKAKYYMFNLRTKKPMSLDEVNHVADSTIIDSILEACFAITLAKWTEGKK